MSSLEAIAERTNEELIEMYQKSRDPLLRQEVVSRYSYIVKMIAMQMRGTYISFTEMGDIINECLITLMAALDSFDPSKNVKFESYASLRMRGTVIDLVRKQDWLPRSVRKAAKTIDEAQAKLFSDLGRHPTDQEMADHLGVSLEKYLKLLGDTNLHNVLSLDELLDSASGNTPTLQSLHSDNSGSPEAVLQKGELSGVMADAISTLRPNEQLTISLYYTKGLNMREIARVLDVKEPRVSQIHANAIRKLRIILLKYMQEG